MSEQKIEAFWRDATAEDVAKVMKGEKVEARFRDSEGTSWCLRKLIGWNTGLFRCDRAEGWKHCQVYDPPEWYTNKPDPGEGYRLLEKFPAEELQPEDDWWKIESKDWLPSRRACRGEQQDEDVWYRRRIEPNSPEKLESSRSKDYIPSGWIKVPNDEPRLASDAYWSQGASEWCLIGDNRVEYANRDKWPAIRQVNSYISLMSAPTAYEWVTSVGDRVRLPNGKQLGVTKQGFEVL